MHIDYQNPQTEHSLQTDAFNKNTAFDKDLRTVITNDLKFWKECRESKGK